MQRRVCVLCCASGYIKDLVSFTDDPAEACFFVSQDRAWQALLTAKEAIKQRCWIAEASIPFPLPKPISSIN